MSRTTIKPVPGYGDVLSDFNRVPVLTLADRVRQDIVLPVLGKRSDSALAKSDSRFMKSVKGSSLIHRSPVVLAELETESVFLRPGEPVETWKPAQRGFWISVDHWGPTYTDITVVLYNGLDDVIYEMIWTDPILWLPWIQGRLYLRATGPVERYAYVRLAQYG